MPSAAKLRHLGADTLFVAVPKTVGVIALLFLHLYAIRHLDPEAYGAFGLSLTCLVVFESFVGSSLDLGILREADALRADGGRGFSTLERSAIMLKLGFGLALLFLVGVFGTWLGPVLFGAVADSRIFMALAMAGTGVLLVRSVQVHFQVWQRFALFGAADLAHTLLRVGLVCGLLATGHGSLPLLVGAYATAAFVVAAWFGAPLLTSGAGRSWLNLAAYRRLAGYGTGVLFVGAFGTVLASLDMFALALLSNPTQLGIYRAALTVALLPELFGTFLAQVFSPRITGYCREGTFSQVFARFQTGAFVAGIVIVLAGLLLAEPVIALLFPAKYGASTEVIMMLLPAGAAGLIAFPLAVSFLAFFALRKIFLVDCLMAPFMVAAYYGAASTGGALSVAAVTAVSRLLKALILHGLVVPLARRIDDEAAPARTGGQPAVGLPPPSRQSLSP